jgi:hypothetical protein
VDIPSNEHGQVLPFVAFVIVVAGLLAVGVAQVGRAAVDRSQARTAADAGALAAAGADRATGVEVARRNGADVVEVGRDGDRFRVTTRVGGALGAASALRVDPPPVEGIGSRAGLAPAMLAALRRADELLGVEVPITSGYRSIEHQRRLWDRRHTNPYPVAPPGRSRHQSGLAVDVPSAFVPRLLTVASAAGLCRPLPVSDPVHFELCGGR